VKSKEEERQESINREERVQRQCQLIKAQLDQCRKEQERLLIQIKSLMAEKERLTEETRKREASVESEADRAKSLEQRLL